MSCRIPFRRVDWITSSFLISTALIALFATPVYLWHFGLDWFHVAVFALMFMATGMSITLGYHRLFAHLSFKARWPVRLLTLVFGACAFENSVLHWVSDHRKHHKHVDHDDDPYDISKGFFWAHMGWIMFKLHPEPPLDNVNDLLRDRLVMWQHRWWRLIAVTIGLALPALLGWLWDPGWSGFLGGLLIGGICRVVAVQHCTFFINSLCHTIGKQPYSDKCSARDSFLMSLFTFGEGYHNYHHEFQHDYRNGIKPWNFDPTKWTIWLLAKIGLAGNLRRVPLDQVKRAEAALQQKRQSTHAPATTIEDAQAPNDSLMV
jgi:stearoyl-CoA desaturase (Delta-9 desaturase)